MACCNATPLKLSCQLQKTKKTIKLTAVQVGCFGQALRHQPPPARSLC